LKEFFEKVGPVTEAQIVKDRISQRSKGYVLGPAFLCDMTDVGFNANSAFAVLDMSSSRMKRQLPKLSSLPVRSS